MSEETCEVCGATLEWEDCQACQGSGWDPDIYAVRCTRCGGSGARLVCPNADDERHR